MNGKTNFHKISIISYLIYKLREMPFRILLVFLMELEKLYLKFMNKKYQGEKYQYFIGCY